MTATTALRSPAVYASPAMRPAGYLQSCQDYVSALNALDDPFFTHQRESAMLRMARKSHAPGQPRPRASAAAAGPTQGLVCNETKVQAIAIDTGAKRVKRMRTAVQHSARMIDFDTSGGGFRYVKKLLTLTYADVDGWEPGHIGEFTRSLRRWCEKRGIRLRSVWVAELQQRGALHYHVVVWLPRGHMIPAPDRAGWWPHGCTNVKAATNPTAYLAKYASKTGASEAARYPKGARMHGACGLDKEGKRHLRYWQSPIWVRDALHGTADIRKVVGGYVDRFTGEFLPSPWVVVFQGGQAWAIRKPLHEEILQ